MTLSVVVPLGLVVCKRASGYYYVEVDGGLDPCNVR